MYVVQNFWLIPVNALRTDFICSVLVHLSDPFTEVYHNCILYTCHNKQLQVCTELVTSELLQ